MSVYQISKIQIRRGQTAQTGFPQLDSGELGWSIDEQQLYIGNGAVSEGAPAIGNTRILTSNDANLFTLNADYVYQDYNVVTGPSSNPYITRTLQSKLDDVANLRDFGGVGDGVTDNTSALQRAVTYTANNSKLLVIPEGSYVITGTVYVPPNAEIRGIGIGKSNIINNSTNTMFQTVDALGNQFPSITSGVNSPKYVNIAGITFYSTLTNNPILSLDCVSSVDIMDCKFVGAASTSTSAIGINLRGQVTLTCNDVSIKNNQFFNLGSAITSNYDMTNIDIVSNNFESIDTAISFNASLASGNSTGPIKVKIANNEFYKINQEAIYVGTNTNGVSIVKSDDNNYNLVGFGYSNTASDVYQVSDVISFNTFGNTSSNDFFSRLQAINIGSNYGSPISTNTVNLSTFSNIVPAISGPVNFNSNESDPFVINGTGTTYLYVWPTNTYRLNGIVGSGPTIEIDYSLIKNEVLRTGKFTALSYGGYTSYNDEFEYYSLDNTSDGNIVLGISTSRSDCIIVTLDNNDLNIGYLTYSVNVRQ